MGRIFSLITIVIGLLFTVLSTYLGYKVVEPIFFEEVYSIDMIILALFSGYYIIIIFLGGILFLFMGLVVNTLCDIRSKVSSLKKY